MKKKFLSLGLLVCSSFLYAGFTYASEIQVNTSKNLAASQTVLGQKSNINSLSEPLHKAYAEILYNAAESAGVTGANWNTTRKYFLDQLKTDNQLAVDLQELVMVLDRIEAILLKVGGKESDVLKFSGNFLVHYVTLLPYRMDVYYDDNKDIVFNPTEEQKNKILDSFSNHKMSKSLTDKEKLAFAEEAQELPLAVSSFVGVFRERFDTLKKEEATDLDLDISKNGHGLKVALAELMKKFEKYNTLFSNGKPPIPAYVQAFKGDDL